jgi:ferredoxin-NADP reductase
MSNAEAAKQESIDARVVHRSVLVDRPGTPPVVKLMLNISPGDRLFEAGCDIAIGLPGDDRHGLRHYTVEAVGEVPFEDSIDLTIFVRRADAADSSSVADYLASIEQGQTLPLYGPFAYPFYAPMGSRSNLIFIGAGCGMVPFRWLAHKIHQRRLDWMGKVLMLEGTESGLERRYLNDLDTDQDQYFDAATHRAFERLKTRYSAVALDDAESRAVNMEAMWRLMGQGSVFVYLAGYRDVAERMDAAMDQHLRLSGRWQEAKSALIQTGHWLEFLYD